MGIISSASRNSLWRGYDYFVGKRVLSFTKISDFEYSGIVKGSQQYHVTIDVNHSRKSTCDCPLAKGKRIVCKHKVALFFAIFPHEAEALLKRAEEYEEEEEERREQHVEEIRQEVFKLSKVELRERLIDALLALEDNKTDYY